MASVLCCVIFTTFYFNKDVFIMYFKFKRIYCNLKNDTFPLIYKTLKLFL